MTIIINATIESAFRVLLDSELLQYLQDNILSKFGGEFSIGGVFNVANEEGQRYIYRIWETVAPLLERIFGSLQQQGQPLPPILQAAILAKAPTSIVLNIIHRFEYSILARDSLNRLPIIIALEEQKLLDHDSSSSSSIGRDKGEIIQHHMKATAKAQNRSIVHVAAEYGLKWSDISSSNNSYNMRELAMSNVEEVINGYDSFTGLRVFMLVAVGSRKPDWQDNNNHNSSTSSSNGYGHYSGSCDLSSIYGLMKMSPIGCHYDVQHLQNGSINKKRKRIE